MKEHNDLILELPNFIPESLCDSIIDKFEKDPEKTRGYIEMDGRIIVDKNLKDSDEICISMRNHKWINEFTESKKYIKKAVDLYQKCLKEEYDKKQRIPMFGGILFREIKDIKTVLIQRQARGVKYAWHYDGGIPSNDYLLVIAYLNTLEPSEGGETEFLYGRKIKPEKGKIMISPASWTYPHCGNIVNADYKYILTVIVEY